jgi:hypothetical protein
MSAMLITSSSEMVMSSGSVVIGAAAGS